MTISFMTRTQVNEESAMAASDIHPSPAVDQQKPLRSALFKSFRAAFIVAVTGGTLAGTGLVLWLLKALATSRYGVYFGV
ncbi:hypothetical protein A9X03_21060 [Mycobacterium sp. E1715]|nr:hypothetical protein A9X03_21060 [Mycobacterium sp. E1715]